MATSTTDTSNVSMSDLLTALKNVVTALNNASQTYLNVNGLINKSAISSATVVKSGTGRLAVVSVTTAGSAAGAIYDGTSATSTSNIILTIPNTVGAAFVNIPVSNGIVVAPGSGQVVTVSYS